MTKKQRAVPLVEALKKEYPDAICSLTADNPFELLVATRLSAQCTDARVNLVTPALFSKYRTLDDYVNADVKDIEDIIKLHSSLQEINKQLKTILSNPNKSKEDKAKNESDAIDKHSQKATQDAKQRLSNASNLQ